MHGVIPILPTPFADNGAIDEDSLGRVVDYVLAHQVDGVAVLGMASEGFALTESERDTVIRCAVERVAGRVPVVAGCSHNSPEAVRQLAQDSHKAGAAAVMTMPPTLGSASPAEMTRYFAGAADAGLPVMVQDNPSWTGVAIAPGCYVQLAEVPGIEYVKVETRHPPTTMRMIKSLTGDRFSLFGGLAGNWLPEEVAAGSVGTMPGSIMPGIYVEVMRRFAAGDRVAANRIFAEHHPLIRVTGSPAVGIAMTKWLLARDGVIASPTVRGPLTALTEQDIEDLTAVLDDLPTPPTTAPAV